MMKCKPGEIILIPFPFSDLSGAKKRPALILTAAKRWNELICVMLTSSPKGYNEVPLLQWKQSGLPKPTVARAHRLFTIDGHSVIRKLGKASEDDFNRVLSAVIATIQNGHI
jgi:mRNA interferase MazF